ncbi:MAG TPA: methyltransferase domain-containing protein [Ignavibacteria bacterium]|nr:methyltransferase domain-containing protein [Ignavibacteria bacterium]
MRNELLKQHWEEIYKTKDTTSEVSWYQDTPRISIDLILSTGVDKSSKIIDIGGGDSKFVDKLLELGFQDLSVLDISTIAIKKAKAMLGNKARLVTWIESDILDFETDKHFEIWHDRAAFHFLTKKEDIANYVEITNHLINPGGYLIISTFSTNGPKKCSGLAITQYSENSMKEQFAEKFHHIKSFEQIHTTPFDTKQNFLWSVFQRLK